ncbi:Translational activator of cytochrome c oxidase 1 [Strongyloides ratti]|uniref:Translational activator of cytochrome c oxidase 1 n=1 Tax=Strongyloides ratti TaxID=34506 RepID=A0A090LJ03_STRRB|nr:Translational activator of cytochrome c oxidase 1 [Strongyloides ratti]CEF67500.1 Translational activator of cytochrome c oxidase 1 [Strongyloides ratti]
MLHIRYLIGNLSFKLNGVLSVSGINTINLLHSSPTFLKGHSKWQNIKERKGKNDLEKSRKINFILSKVKNAVEAGGFDLKLNNKLNDLLQEFKSNGLPSETFHSYLKKMKEKPEKTVYYNVIGPSGSFFIIECETDKEVLLEGAIKKNFSKIGGFRLSKESLKNKFEEKGVVTISGYDKNNKKLTLDEVEEAAIDFDIEEVIEIDDENENDSKKYELYCDKNNLFNIESKISNSHFVVENVIKKMRALYTISVTKEEEEKIEKFYELIAKVSDVKNIFDNINEN